MLKVFSPGELQSFIKTDIPYKHGRKPDSPITLRPSYTKAASIPASTIHRFQTGEYTPRKISIKKLSDAYDRYRYAQLVSVGANRKDAAKFCRLSPNTIAPILNNYATWAYRILANNHRVGHTSVRIEHITWGMSHPKWQEHLQRKIGYNDWEMISKLSGLRKHRRRASRRPRQFEH